MTRELSAGLTDLRPRRAVGGVATLAALALAVVVIGVWHLTQGTSGLGPAQLLRGLFGAHVEVGGVGVSEIFAGSRLPRLAAGILVGFALGVAGCLLQSVTRNQLASPDTLAVSAGAYFALTVVAMGAPMRVARSVTCSRAFALPAPAMMTGRLAARSDAAASRILAWSGNGVAGRAISFAEGVY